MAPVVSISAASAPSCTAPSASAFSVLNGMRTTARPSFMWRDRCRPRLAMNGTETITRAGLGDVAVRRPARRRGVARWRASGRRHLGAVEGPVGDEPLRDALPRVGAHVARRCTRSPCRAAAPDAVGDDVLADRGREVGDGQVERPGLELAALGESRSTPPARRRCRSSTRPRRRAARARDSSSRPCTGRARPTRSSSIDSTRMPRLWLYGTRSQRAARDAS